MAGPGSHILDQLRRDGLISRSAVSKPLAGGVSSDVFLIEEGSTRFVVKQALPRLKVQDYWPADISRNRFESEFLTFLGRVLPEAAPQIVAVREGYFVMEYFGPEYENWKTLLLRGVCQEDHALQAAHILGTIHRESFRNADLAAQFETTSNFHQLRTDPYLLTTGFRYPELQELFEREASRLEKTRECLVHGDYSPKNILIGKDRLVLLDCEVAWYGDPAFDLAFLMNHFLLKALFHAPSDVGLQGLARVFIEGYHRERGLPAAQRRDLDSRTARLLLTLLLARIDGKSPVEYLTSDPKRALVRRFVRSGLVAPEFALHKVLSEWFSNLQLRA